MRKRLRGVRLRVMLLEETMSSEEARGGERGREGSQQGNVVRFLKFCE